MLSNAQERDIHPEIPEQNTQAAMVLVIFQIESSIICTSLITALHVESLSSLICWVDLQSPRIAKSFFGGVVLCGNAAYARPAALFHTRRQINGYAAPAVFQILKQIRPKFICGKQNHKAIALNAKRKLKETSCRFRIGVIASSAKRKQKCVTPL